MAGKFLTRGLLLLALYHGRADAQSGCGCSKEEDSLKCIGSIFSGSADSKNIDFEFRDGKTTTGKASVEFACTQEQCVLTASTSHLHDDKYEPVRAEITTCTIQRDLKYDCLATFSGVFTWDIPPEDLHLGRRRTGRNGGLKARAGESKASSLLPDKDSPSFGQCSCEGEELKCSLKKGAFGTDVDVKGRSRECDKDSLYLETARKLAETVYCKNLYAIRDNPVVNGIYQSPYVLVERNVAEAVGRVMELGRPMAKPTDTRSQSRDD